MEVDPATIASCVAVCISASTIIAGYGRMKAQSDYTKEKLENARKDRQTLFTQYNDLKTQTEVQESTISTLKSENGQLFRLHDETNKSMAALGNTLSGLAKDVHYIRDSIKEIRKE